MFSPARKNTGAAIDKSDGIRQILNERKENKRLMIIAFLLELTSREFYLIFCIIGVVSNVRAVTEASALSDTVALLE